MDLASFFFESVEAARSYHDRAKNGELVPAVPDCDGSRGNAQAIDNNDISRSSRSSRSEISDDKWQQDESAQAGASARAGERARGWLKDGREQREQREQPAGSDTYSSRSLSSKRELKGKPGTDGLPAAPTAAALPDFEERAAILEYDCGLTRLAAEAQARRECQQTTSASAVTRPLVAALPREDGLALWRAGIIALGLSAAPCPGYRGDEWVCTRSRALDFLDAFGAQAEALGWTAPRLFGVHPTAGIVRVDACGSLVLPGGGAVRAITATEISFGHLTHREKPGQPQGVPIWEFGR